MAYLCVIFDFDGTLADTESFVVHIANQLAEQYGFHKVKASHLKRLKTMEAWDVLDHLNVTKWKVPFILRDGRRILNQKIQYVDLIQRDWPAILRAMHAHGIKMGIISSNSKKNIRGFLKNNQIDVFDFVLSSSLNGKKRIIQKVIRKHGYKHHQVLYVGDEVRDIDAARAAQVDVASVAWGFNTPEILAQSNPTYLIKDVNDLLPLCKIET